MAPTVPTCIPSELTAGVTWRWTLSFADFPASAGWVATAYFRGAAVLDVVATADGDAHAFVATADATADVVPGTYEVVVRAALAGEKYDATAAVVTVRPDLAQSGSGDRLTHEERCIPLLEEALERRCTVDLKAYTVGGRQASAEDLREMRQMLASYRAHVLMRRHGGRLPGVATYFRRPVGA